MPLTLVQPGDDAEAVAARLRAPPASAAGTAGSEPIEIDCVVVDAFEAAGLHAAHLRDAILRCRNAPPERIREVARHRPSCLELHGSFGSGSFVLDRMVAGTIVYFATSDPRTAHVADYSRMDQARSDRGAVGRTLSDVLEDAAFPPTRSPRIVAAEHRTGDALRLDVRRDSVLI